MRYEDGTIGLMSVNDGLVTDVQLLQGDENIVSIHRDKCWLTRRLECWAAWLWHAETAGLRT